MNYEFTHDLRQLLRKFQQQAAFSVAQITKCVLDSPIEEGFNLRNGLAMEAPITAYHVTPSVMTTAIEKAVLYLVQVQVSKASEMTKSNTDSNSIKEDLPHRHIDCLMKGLLSLEVTIGGSQEVGRVLKSLLQDYGDIISECWSCDYET